MTFLDKNSPTPFYLQIYETLADDIAARAYEPGDRLPATRRLASELGVSRNTVVSAYEQLVSEGFVEGRKGSGYVVRDVDYLRAGAEEKGEATTGPDEACDEMVYDFEHSRPDARQFPWKAWRDSMRRALDAIDAHGFSYRQDPQGMFELRNALARYLRREERLEASPDQIVVTCGHPYSIEVVATLFKGVFDLFATEDPAYDGTCDVLRERGFGMETIPVETDGVSTDRLGKLDSRLLCLTPRHHFLTGARLSDEKHRRLVFWAQTRDAYLVEDCYTVDLPTPRLVFPPGARERVIYLGTFSKTLSPGIRAAYVVLPEKLLDRYRNSYRTYDMQVPVANQLAIADFMDSGAYGRHLRTMATYNERRQNALVEAIEASFGEKARLSGQRAGEHLLLDLDVPFGQAELVERARRQGVRVYPTTRYYLDETRCPRSQVMLGFGSVPTESYPDAMRRLARAWL